MQLTRHDNGNIELTLTLAWPTIQSEYEKVVTDTVAMAEIEGFRKGKAPREMVEPRLDKTKLYSKAIERLLPPAYSAAVKEGQLQPVVQPHIHLVSGEEGQAWIFSAVTCELPQATLPTDFEAGLKAVKPEGEEKDKDTLSPRIAWLREHATITVPDILVEEEANHRLTGLVDNLNQLGLSMDSYLQSRKTTAEQLKADTAAQARTDLATEFVLHAVQTQKSLADRKSTLDFLQNLA